MREQQAGRQILIPCGRVPERGPQYQLRQNYSQSQHTQSAQRNAATALVNRGFGRHPIAGGEHRQANGNEKEQLCQSSVRRRNSQRQIQLDRQAAEQTLRDYSAQRDPTQALYPRTSLANLKINGQDDRQDTDASGHDAVPMLPEQIPNHFGKEL